MNSSHAANDQDSDTVRSNFRVVIRYGAILVGIVCLVHSAMFFLHGSPEWVWTFLVAVLCGPCWWMTGLRRSFPVFLTGTLSLLAMIVALETHLTLQLGRDVAFHLLLITLIPIIVASGRIGLTSKVVVVSLVLAYIIWLDQTENSALHGLTQEASTTSMMRIINMAIAVMGIAGVMLRYFFLVTAQHAKLQALASRDPLTGLYNRRQLLLLADQARKQSLRHAIPFSVALADLDHFKLINDEFGHDAGDAVLCYAAHLFAAGVRESDSVGRWGGEEFLILLPHTGIDDARRLIERIRQQLAESPVDFRGRLISVTGTFGVTSVGDSEKLDVAIARADAALYEGKTGGRNRVVVQ